MPYGRYKIKEIYKGYRFLVLEFLNNDLAEEYRRIQTSEIIHLSDICLDQLRMKWNAHDLITTSQRARNNSLVS